MKNYLGGRSCRSALLVILIGWLFGQQSACTSDEEQHLSVNIVFDERYPRWFELQVWKRDQCLSASEAAYLSAGFPVHRQTFVPNTMASSIGELDPGIYSMLVLARDSDCLPTHYACQIFNVAHDLNVQLEPVAIDWYLEAGSTIDYCPDDEFCDVELGCTKEP